MLARLDGLTQEIIGFEAEPRTPAGLAAIRARRTGWRWITNAQAGRRPGAHQFTRQRGAPGIGAPCAARREIGRPARANAAPWRRRNACGPRATGPEAQRGELEKLEARRRPSWKITPASAPNWQRSKNSTAVNASARPAWSSSSARPPTAATPLPGELRGWRTARRLLADNIELDQKGALLPSRSPRS